MSATPLHRALLPRQMMMDVSSTYIDIAERIVGRPLDVSDNPRDEIVRVLRDGWASFKSKPNKSKTGDSMAALIELTDTFSMVGQIKLRLLSSRRRAMRRLFVIDPMMRSLISRRWTVSRSLC